MSSYNYKCLTVEPKWTFISDTHTSENSFWQSPLWAEILRDTHQAQNILLCSHGKAKILIERRKIVGKYTGLYILGIREKLITKALLKHIKDKIAQKSDLFLQIEPIDPSPSFRASSERSASGVEGHDTESIPAYAGVTSNAPFRRFIEPITAVLDLEKTTEEKLLQSFAEKGRYNIRVAQKRGVTTRWVKGYKKCGNTWKTYIQEFFELLDETTKRDGFAHNTLTYYQYFVEILEAHNAGWLLVAEKDWILHAAGIFAYWNDTAIYYYGASSGDREIRRDMATYLLQWDAIREAMRRKCTTYDFLWISPDWKGKLAGVTEFKLRFNPEKKELAQEIVITYKPILLKFLQIVSKVRKTLQWR